MGVVLDSKLNFSTHISHQNRKSSKLIWIIKKLYTSLQWSGFLTTYKWFVGPLLDYGDILYDKPKIRTLKNNTEKVKYRLCFAITGAIKETWR